MQHQHAPTGPLAGLKILDFTRVLSGPFCTALLGDLGAEVIKVERPEGDDYRHVGPMRNGESALFNVVNRNKKSLVLDLRRPEAVAVVRDLVTRMDVVVENFRPGVADKLGIGYDTLSALNPRLIYTSISGFGQDGPAAHRPAYDLIIQAMSGLMASTGFPEGPPTLVGEAISDVLSGLFASWGTLAALQGLQRSGRGTHVDAAMFDSTLAFTVTAVSRFLFTGRDAQRVGNRHPLSAPFGVYQARDGYFALAVLNDKLFRQLLAVIGRSDQVGNPDFEGDERRAQHEAALRGYIEDWAGALTVDEVLDQLGTAAIPSAPIWNVRQALDSEQIRYRGLLQDVPHPRLEGLRLPHQPLKFSGWDLAPVQAAPELGADTHHVLQDLLGFTRQHIQELQACGALGAAVHPSSQEASS
ncbi:MAG TPA: CoA transferase [Castellaniella sp.]|uniref:CaiB/BaiF CoA transferase family protein n=1 Tax=Castellaniella sp. TaxID=1955812 RepID=UPI002EF3F507